MVIFSTSGKTQWKHTPQIWEQLRHLVKIEVTVDMDFWSNRSHNRTKHETKVKHGPEANHKGSLKSLLTA